MIFGVGSVTLIWTATGITVSAAECGSPKPWNYFTGRCIDRVGLSHIIASNLLM